MTIFTGSRADSLEKTRQTDCFHGSWPVRLTRNSSRMKYFALVTSGSSSGSALSKQSN